MCRPAPYLRLLACYSMRAAQQTRNPTLLPQSSEPSLPKTLMASWLIESDEAKETMQNLADFYLVFPAQEFGLLDFNRVKEIAERGYAYTSEKLAEWDRDPAGLPTPHGKDE
jgi:predicted acylesterase/phospholipase RssA